MNTGWKQSRELIVTRDFTNDSRRAKIPGGKGESPQDNNHQVGAAQAAEGEYIMAKTAEKHPLLAERDEKIAEYHKQTEAAEAARGDTSDEGKKAFASANARKSNLSQAIRSLELDMLLLNHGGEANIEFEPWDQPKTKRSAGGKKVEVTQEQVVEDLRKVGSIYNMPGIDAETKKAANVRINKLLATAKRAEYTVTDPRPEEDRPSAE